jgi:Uma2 family endonuclease
MGIPKIDTGPMTVEEFYAFTDARPDDEKWELIDGEPVLNASPSPFHQIIAGNVAFALGLRERQQSLPWRAIPGIGVLASDTNRPEPDVMVIPSNLIRDDPFGRDTRDALVLFEVMSPSTSTRDLKWKRTVYTAMPALAQYVVIAQDAIEVVDFARSNNFVERRLTSLSSALDLPSLSVTLPLSEIYRDTGLR